MAASKAISKVAKKAKPKAATKKPPKKMDDMEAILKSMSAKERREFLESMGFQNKEMMRSYYMEGGSIDKGKGHRAYPKPKPKKGEKYMPKPKPKGKTMKKKGGKVSGAPHNRLY